MNDIVRSTTAASTGEVAMHEDEVGDAFVAASASNPVPVAVKETVQGQLSHSVPFSGEAADVADTTVVFETPGDISDMKHHEFTVHQAPSTNSVQVLISHDGTNYEVTPIQVFSDQYVKGAVVQSLQQISAIGNYYFDRVVKKWKLVNNGATGVVTKVRGSYSR